MDPRILREGREEKVAPNPTRPFGGRLKRRPFLDEGGRKKVSRHQEQVPHNPLLRLVVEKHEVWNRRSHNALDHGLVCGVYHSVVERMGLAFQLEWLRTFGTTEIHDLRTRPCRFEPLGKAGRTVEVLADP